MEWNKQVLEKIQHGVEPNQNSLSNGTSNIAFKIQSKIKNIMDVGVSPPEPLSFRGNLYQNWWQFKRRFDEYMAIPENEQKSSVEKVSLLLSVIGDDGVQLYKTFELDESIRRNYGMVLSCFANYCKRERDVDFERLKFNRRVQGLDEQFESFLREVQFMVKLCEFGDQESASLLDKIVNGVRDKALQEKLKEQNVTLEKAIEICRSYETSVTCSPDIPTISSSENPTKSSSEAEKVASVNEAHTISSESEADDDKIEISFCVGSFPGHLEGTPEPQKEAPSEVHTISSDSDSEEKNVPKIDFCVGSFPEDSLEGTQETNDNDKSESDSSKCKLVINDVHTLSDSDSQGSLNVMKKKKPAISDSEDEKSPSEAPKKYSRIKTLSEFQFKKKAQLQHTASNDSNDSTESNDSRKRKASPPREKKKKSKKYKKSCSDDMGDWSDNVYDSDADSDAEVSNKMSASQQKVFDFFNTASAAELLQVPTCTEKKVNSIIESRPFENWRDLVHKMETAKHMTGNILNCALDVLKTRLIISKLMQKCLDLAISTEKTIAAGLASVKEQPSILAPGMELKSYQMVGLNWLIAMHHQGLSGILADEMGLGKTIQVIAFLSYLHETGEAKHPHLIVVPATTLENWAVEFEKWSPSLRVVVYHGHPDDRRALRVQWFKEKFTTMDVIITTYNIISSNYEEKKMFRIINLHYVVFDEAHMLKNMNAQRYFHLFSINAKKRILLTGTPMQNSLLELMSLLNFVMPNMFSDKIQYIKTFFSKNNKMQGSGMQPFEQEQVDLAKRIMKPFILRRLKDDVLSDLPTKTQELVKCPLDKDQKEKYDEYSSIVKESALLYRETYNYMSSFMQLRRLANHPLACQYVFKEDVLSEMAVRLAEDILYRETHKDNIYSDLTFMSDYEIHKLTTNYPCISEFRLADSYFLGSGKFNKLDELLPRLKKEGHRVLLFSQFVFMLDILEEYMRIREHDYLRLDGSTKSLERQDLIDNYNEDSNIFVFLLTTRAGGIGINLTTADTVIIHDIDFNPYNDKQAEDRCHRLGQTKPVHIIRLLSENTVEEYIYAKAQEKLNLEQELISSEESEDTKNVEDLLKEVLGIPVKPT